jgi:hypothetical protein
MIQIPAARAMFSRITAGHQQQQKHFGRWLSALGSNYTVDAKIPWITFDAFDFISDHLPPTLRVFEYGSGGSTLFWSGLGGNITTIEHDLAWYNLMHSKIGSRSVEIRHIPPTIDPQCSPHYAADPERYSSAALESLKSKISCF